MDARDCLQLLSPAAVCALKAAIEGGNAKLAMDLVIRLGLFDKRE